MKKNNNKGFTIVELLAVIFLLSIVSVLFTTNYMLRYNKTEEEAKKYLISEIESAADTYLSLNPTVLEPLYSGEEASVTISVDSLENYGLLAGKNRLDVENQYVRITISEDDTIDITYLGEDKTYEYYLEASTINILVDEGNTLSTWCEENKFKNLSFKSAISNETINSNFTSFNLKMINCNVMPNKPGIYIMTYEYTDKNGSSSETTRIKVRTVEVIKNQYEVQFNANGGVIDKNNCTSPFIYKNDTCYKYVNSGKKYDKLPIPIRDGYELEGWYYGVDKIENDTIFDENSDVILEAKWRRS